MTIALSVFLVNMACTLIMCGAIWLAQLSTYPLFAFVGKEEFLRYESEHVRRISGIAWFIITLELITGAVMVLEPLPEIPFALILAGFLLIVCIWLSTWIVQFPIHKKLEQGFSADLHRKLVVSNWQRTIAWTIRGILVLWMLTLLL